MAKKAAAKKTVKKATAKKILQPKKQLKRCDQTAKRHDKGRKESYQEEKIRRVRMPKKGRLQRRHGLTLLFCAH